MEDVEGGRELSEFLIVLPWLTRLLTPSMRADHLESQMRVQLEIQEGIDLRVELEADYRSYGSPAIAHKRAEHSAHKPIDRINLRLVHHVLYCATQGLHQSHALYQ